MRVVMALGGNALIQRGQSAEIATQRQNVETACEAISALVREGHDVIVTHGNGPQVGLLALQAAAFTDVAPYPLDVLGAESEGMVGYLLAQGLQNRLPDRDVVALLTQVEVDRADPAFARPTKPIGPTYDVETAERLGREHGWQFAADGAGHRRVVPSPAPTAIVEMGCIRQLVEAGATVICVGGGGIPVARGDDGSLVGVEAVIDKDRAAALLAEEMQADLLVLLTDVDGVYVGWGTAAAARIAQAPPYELRRRNFADGSMGPKVDAACSFATRTGREAVIGSLREARGLVDALLGTRVANQHRFTLARDDSLFVRAAV